MAKRVAAAAASTTPDEEAPTHDAERLGAAIRTALCDRIGADRFDVWFSDVRIIVAKARSPRGGPTVVTIQAGEAPGHDWLKRNFHADALAVVAALCGPAARVAWQARPLPGAGAPSRRRSAGRPSAAARRAGSPPGEPAAPAAGPDADRPRSVEPAAARRQGPRLEEFVVGTSNRMAFGAVEIAATRPGEMSPLVIHGPSGVGKTHLVEGLCSRARELHPGLSVVSLSAEQFMNGFLQALHGGGLPGFRRSLRGADLVVIDDLQFLLGNKKATLLELQHTLDALHRQGRQVVFACDRDLDALAGLGADLITRLRGGMTARVLPPDFDVRRGIVAAIAARRSLAVPDEVVGYVATHMTRHARELYGAVNRLEATSLMLGVPITPDMAEEALADLVRSSGRSMRLADVERAVCKAFGIEAGSLQSSRRARTASQPRMLAMFLARKHTHAALTEIGSYFGRRSHSTVIAAQKAVGDWLAKRSRIVLAETAWDVEEAIRRVEDVLRAG